MFHRLPPVLYLTRTQAMLFDGLHIDHALFTMNWNGTDIGSVIATLKQHTKETEWNVMFGNDLSYTFSFTIPKVAKDTSSVIQELSRIVPEEISEKNIVWRIIPEIGKSNTVSIQTVVFPLLLVKSLNLVCQENHLIIQKIFSLSSVLAQETKIFPKPHIIYCIDQEKTCTVSYKGVVYYSETFKEMTVQHIQEMSLILRRITPMQQIGSVVINTDLSQVFANSHTSYQFVKHLFQPLLWLRDHHLDEITEFLSFDPNDEIEDSEVIVSAQVEESLEYNLTPENKSKKNSSRLFILIGILIALMMFTGWYIYSLL